MAERPFQSGPLPTAATPAGAIPVSGRDNPAEPLERAEGAPLRDPVEQRAEAAAPRIATDAEPVRPTPDDALHEMPPDLSHDRSPLRFGALAAIGLLAALLLYALAAILFNQ